MKGWSGHSILILDRAVAMAAFYGLCICVGVCTCLDVSLFFSMYLDLDWDIAFEI